jgi:hypothetical protein
VPQCLAFPALISNQLGRLDAGQCSIKVMRSRPTPASHQHEIATRYDPFPGSAMLSRSLNPALRQKFPCSGERYAQNLRQPTSSKGLHVRPRNSYLFAWYLQFNFIFFFHVVTLLRNFWRQLYVLLGRKAPPPAACGARLRRAPRRRRAQGDGESEGAEHSAVDGQGQQATRIRLAPAITHPAWRRVFLVYKKGGIVCAPG